MNLRPAMFALTALFLGSCALLGPAPAAAAGKDIAVLVVGKGNDADLAARERMVVDQLTRARSQKGWSHKVLPIYSYHFDKTVERTYCEERLKVKASELVVVGLVELESGVPVRFIERDSDVRHAAQTASTLMDRAGKELASHGTQPVVAPVQKPAEKPVAVKPAVKPVTTAPVVKPVATAPAVVKPTAPVVVKPAEKPVAIIPAVTPTTNGVAEHWTLQLGMFSNLEKARAFVGQIKQGMAHVEIRKAPKDNGIVFRVVAGSFASQAEAYSRAKELKEAGMQAFSVRLDPTLGTVVR